MDRRRFLQRTGRLSAALTVVNTPIMPAIEQPLHARRAGRNGKVTLANDSLAWNLEWRDGKLRSTSFDNKLSGHSFPLSAVEELTLTFSAAERRVEIPWWRFEFGQDKAAAAPEQEQGFKQGFQQVDFQDSSWRVTENLLLRKLSGAKPTLDTIRYDGYGWFRRWFELPADGRGEELWFVLGGYDQQDWNEYWIYLNGQEVAHRTAQGRWRVPGQFKLEPGNPAYSSLRFGPGEKNLLAVRTRGIDNRLGGYSDEVLKHYVFKPVWVDQFITVGTPYLQLSDFEILEVTQTGPAKCLCPLRSSSRPVGVTLHYELDGPTRRKWAEIENSDNKDLLLLDVQIDDYHTKSPTSDGGPGEPVFLSDEAFAALEHPTGLNQGDEGRVRLMHFPARRLRPGEKMRSRTALLSVAKSGDALNAFTSYIQSRSPRKQRAISLYTPYGINNQWGGCPALNDEETLGILDVLEKWQQKGLKFDYLTLDQGWSDPTGDLTLFAQQCYPNGPAKIAERVKALGMKFGLWFSITGAAWSIGENPAVKPSFIPGPGDTGAGDPMTPAYHDGYVSNGGVPGRLCIASEPYFSMVRNAVLHHIRENNLKFFKIDMGSYYCNSTEHDHLPGKYSVDAMHDRLLDIAAAARQADPDVYVMWYWGVRSPFFALYGDTIFESGLFMEGSGTSWFPTLYYRDSVTLNLDQSTQFAKTVPPINKDSLGVWLSDTRWGNYMGNERWKEALVMDLGRGGLLFPQIWGDINLLDEHEFECLRAMDALAKSNASLFLHCRNILGDPWKNEVYGYANSRGAHGFLFINNVHFASRKVELHLGPALGLDAAPGTPVEIISHFPDKKRIARADGSAFNLGDVAEIWVRPFEVLMLGVAPSQDVSQRLPARDLAAQNAASMGIALELAQAPHTDWMDFRSADAERFTERGLKKTLQAWTATLPNLDGGPHILAIPVKLRERGGEWRYTPTVVEIVQVVAHVGEQKIQMIPVPDARQYGNTQSAGCSWVVYKFRLSPQWSGKKLEFAVSAYLPDGVEAWVEGWVVEQWWEEHTRPLGDGYFADGPT